MNKEQIAFEKWFASTEPSADIKAVIESGWNGKRWDCNKDELWRAWQARAALDKQDSLELLKEVLNSDMAMREEDEGNESKLLTKIRNHLTGK